MGDSEERSKSDSPALVRQENKVVVPFDIHLMKGDGSSGGA